VQKGARIATARARKVHFAGEWGRVLPHDGVACLFICLLLHWKPTQAGKVTLNRRRNLTAITGFINSGTRTGA
jgi:hypothetical protein